MNKPLNLYENEDLLGTLDILDLDEELIDERLEFLMKRSSFEHNQLKSMLTFLKYKYMICLKEETECENEYYIKFSLKQLMSDKVENVALWLEILSVSLLLNTDRLQNVVEHILQQIMAVDENQSSSEAFKRAPLKTINHILEFCIRNNVIVHSSFLYDELQKIIMIEEKMVDTQFFVKTIPLMINCCQDYNILNLVWDRILCRQSQLNKNDYLILSTLSEFYLPLQTDTTFTKVRSTIIETNEFWKLILSGFTNEDFLVRKCSIYLARRATFCAGERRIIVAQPAEITPIFQWNKEEKDSLKSSWDSLFTLLETLEEKQSHLVLPALRLFDEIINLHYYWNKCALIRALSHEANSVVQQSIQIALSIKNESAKNDFFPYEQLLGALNNTFLYENIHNYKKNRLISLLINFLEHDNNMHNLILSLPSINLSPIPKFYISYALMLISKSNKDSILLKTVIDGFFNLDSPVLNNSMIRCATECCLINFISKCSIQDMKAEGLQYLFNILPTKNLIHRGNLLWKKLTTFIKRSNCNNQISESITPMMEIPYLSGTSEYHVSLAKVFVVLLDAEVIGLSVFIGYLKMLLKYLKDSQHREYSSNVEFDSCFSFILNVVDVVEGEEQMNNDLEHSLFREIFSTSSDILVNYLIIRLRTVTEIKEFDMIAIYINGLQILMSKRITESAQQYLQSLFDMAECLLKTEGITSIQKYFALKILSEYAKKLPQTNSFTKDEGHKKIARLHDSIRNINLSKMKEIERKGKLVSEFNLAKIQISIEYYSTLVEWNLKYSMNLYDIIINLLETGGHGCMHSIIILAQLLLPNLLEAKKISEIETIVNRVWKEFFELRKNDQFKICFKSFIEMLYHRNLFVSPLTYSLLLEYGDNIFELGNQTPFVVCELMQHLAMMSKETGTFMFASLLKKGLTFGMVLRKDQRIEMECCDFFTNCKIDFFIPEEVKYLLNPIPQIRSSALQILKSQDVALHIQITSDLRNMADSKNKIGNRYHGNSLQHRFLLRTLQSLLFSVKTQPDGNLVDNNAKWCIQRLAQQPHHISSRIMLELYIALYIIQNKLLLNSALQSLLSEIPLISYFLIIFHVLKYQLIQCTNEAFKNNEQVYKNFDFVMETYLPHTMGQLFNIRLHAQYLTLKLYEMIRDNDICNKYTMMYNIIRNTFELSACEKNLIKIKNDFFINDFCIIGGLTVNNIYHNIIRLTGVAQDEWVFGTSSNEIIKNANDFSNSVLDDERSSDIENFELEPITESSNYGQVTTNFQKKFIPWKNMLAELGITSEDEMKTKSKNCSNLIVVASLIDRLPNLGGLARTCEVFGVKEYIIDNLRYLQDKEFQNLSVSSERWLNINEIKPGADLKNYLSEMKMKGYIIVGAEQTSSSVPLNNFSFPKNSILFLGHEKEGVPCDLINFMDYCVEIPQYGFVRSLNVHVTASIFIWEYMKQHST